MKPGNTLIDNVCDADQHSNMMRGFFTIETMEMLYRDFHTDHEKSHLGKGD